MVLGGSIATIGEMVSLQIEAIELDFKRKKRMNPSSESSICLAKFSISCWLLWLKFLLESSQLSSFGNFHGF